MKKFDASVVIPAYYEAETIVNTLKILADISQVALQIIVVVDSSSDSTIFAVENTITKPVATKVLVQNYGKGPANAIRFGIDQSEAECIIVMMADGSDDARTIPELINLISRGISVACASRYMQGGQQIGGPLLKKLLSKNAGKILYFLSRLGTHDPTNSFKAYSRTFLMNVDIESRAGFEIGIELVAKAHRMGLIIAEVPTIWVDRTFGASKFQLAKWLPKYLRWFFYCLIGKPFTNK